MSRVSSDDTTFLPAGKKVLRHYVSSVAACSKNDVHIGFHSQIGCGGSGLGSRQKGGMCSLAEEPFFGRACSAVHRYRSPLKAHVALLPPSLNRCLNRQFLRREGAGQVELSFGHAGRIMFRSEEHTSELQSPCNLV